MLNILENLIILDKNLFFQHFQPFFKIVEQKIQLNNKIRFKNMKTCF